MSSSSGAHRSDDSSSSDDDSSSSASAAPMASRAAPSHHRSNKTAVVQNPSKEMNASSTNKTGQNKAYLCAGVLIIVAIILLLVIYAFINESISSSRIQNNKVTRQQDDLSPSPDPSSPPPDEVNMIVITDADRSQFQQKFENDFQIFENKMKELLEESDASTNKNKEHQRDFLRTLTALVNKLEQSSDGYGLFHRILDDIHDLSNLKDLINNESLEKSDHEFLRGLPELLRQLIQVLSSKKAHTTTPESFFKAMLPESDQESLSGSLSELIDADPELVQTSMKFLKSSFDNDNNVDTNSKSVDMNVNENSLINKDIANKKFLQKLSNFIKKLRSSDFRLFHSMIAFGTKPEPLIMSKTKAERHAAAKAEKEEKVNVSWTWSKAMVQKKLRELNINNVDLPSKHEDKERPPVANGIDTSNDVDTTPVSLFLIDWDDTLMPKWPTLASWTQNGDSPAQNGDSPAQNGASPARDPSGDSSSAKAVTASSFFQQDVDKLSPSVVDTKAKSDHSATESEKSPNAGFDYWLNSDKGKQEVIRIPADKFRSEVVPWAQKLNAFFKKLENMNIPNKNKLINNSDEQEQADGLKTIRILPIIVTNGCIVLSSLFYYQFIAHQLDKQGFAGSGNAKEPVFRDLLNAVLRTPMFLGDDFNRKKIEKSIKNQKQKKENADKVDIMTSKDNDNKHKDKGTNNDKEKDKSKEKDTKMQEDERNARMKEDAAGLGMMMKAIFMDPPTGDIKNPGAETISSYFTVDDPEKFGAFLRNNWELPITTRSMLGNELLNWHLLGFGNEKHAVSNEAPDQVKKFRIPGLQKFCAFAWALWCLSSSTSDNINMDKDLDFPKIHSLMALGDAVPQEHVALTDIYDLAKPHVKELLGMEKHFYFNTQWQDQKGLAFTHSQLAEGFSALVEESTLRGMMTEIEGQDFQWKKALSESEGEDSYRWLPTSKKEPSWRSNVGGSA